MARGRKTVTGDERTSRSRSWRPATTITTRSATRKIQQRQRATRDAELQTNERRRTRETRRSTSRENRRRSAGNSDHDTSSSGRRIYENFRSTFLRSPPRRAGESRTSRSPRRSDNSDRRHTRQSGRKRQRSLSAENRRTRRRSRTQSPGSQISGESNPSARHAPSPPATRSRSSTPTDPPEWAKTLLDAVQSKSNEIQELKGHVEALKRTAREDQPKFRFEGNKRQYKFNLDIIEKFKQIVGATGTGEEVQLIATEGMSLVEKRNKLVLIADRDGWDVVQCFEADPLTKDEEEEKKLKAARKEAERAREQKYHARAGKFSKQRAGPRYAKSFGAEQNCSNPGANQTPRGVYFYPTTGQLLINPVPEKKPAVRRCFGCGRAGQFVKED